MRTSTATAVRTYQIDRTHSEATFQVRHLLGKVRGRFSEFEGVIAFEEEAPEASSVRFTIDAKSINTDQADRDAHLRSADFFDVDRFPTLAFASTDVTRTGERTFDVTGTLTLHGVERRLTLPVSYLGRAKDPWGHERAAFEAEIVLNRKDFGLTWNAALETGGFMVGDEVRVSLSVQAIAQAE
jgi:polyisoprenoid-binding protein YceI